MDNLIIVVVLALIIGVAVAYVVRAKKNGVKCVGCPDGKECGKNGTSPCGGGCSGCAMNGSCHNASEQ